MIIFICLAIIMTIFVFLFPEYAWYIVLLALAFEGLTFGVIVSIRKEIESIVRRHRNILREEILDNVEKLYRCKNLNDIVNFRLDR